jgi:hypothetical protein
MGPDRCPLAKELGCKLYGRLNVQVEGQQDELGSFIFRTTGYNSVRTLAARLKYYEAASGGNTKHLPLLLRLRAKSTTQSHRTPVYYVDLTLRDGQTLAEAVSTARKAADEQLEAGIDTAELEQAARLLLQNGQFEDTEEEVPQLLEEFYPAVEGSAERKRSRRRFSPYPAHFQAGCRQDGLARRLVSCSTIASTISRSALSRRASICARCCACSAGRLLDSTSRTRHRS